MNEDGIRIGFFFILMACLNEIRALRDVRINVPPAVIRGDDAILECYYDLESDQLYTVKWYLGNTEFCRYTPKEIPPIKQFPSHSGLTVRESESNNRKIVLERVPMSVSGRYTCEVSADAPSFYTSVQTGYLQVVDLPKKDPYISGLKTRYHYGETLRANCTSEQSNPAANLTWIINGNPAAKGTVRNYIQTDGNFQTAHSSIRLQISKTSFHKHRLKIRCVAGMYDIYYRSTEKSVESEHKKKHHHHHGTSTTMAPYQWELSRTVDSDTTLIGDCASSTSASLLLIVFSLTLR